MFIVFLTSMRNYLNLKLRKIKSISKIIYVQLPIKQHTIDILK